MRSIVNYWSDKHFERWLGSYLRDEIKRRTTRQPKHRLRHLLFCFCDHYEPLWGDASENTGRARVRSWVEKYPKTVLPFRDADGRHPQHSFFFPCEQYRPEFLEELATLVREGFGEVEIHLHHDADTANGLRETLRQALRDFGNHGHISRDKTERPRFAFIHGNWCLANARSDGRYCGVDDELPILFEEGCYADFTFPAAPDESQPRIVNQLYWPVGSLSRRRAYEHGERACVGVSYHDRMLIVEGPLAIVPKRGRIPLRIENGHITGTDPASISRVKTWVSRAIHVDGRPEWVFVKVHTHGAPESTAASLLGTGGVELHSALTQHYNDGQMWKLHYVTAREMFNIARAAMDGRRGSPDDFRDYIIRPPAARAS